VSSSAIVSVLESMLGSVLEIFLRPYLGVVLATVPVLDPAGFIGLRGNDLTPSKIDDFLCEQSL
jgi:hypothetical protein